MFKTKETVLLVGLMLSGLPAAYAQQELTASVSKVSVSFSEAQMETTLSQSGKLASFNSAMTNVLAPSSAVISAVPCLDGNTAAATLVRSLVMRDVAKLDASLVSTAYVAQVPTYTQLEKKHMYKAQFASLYPHAAVAQISSDLLTVVEPLVSMIGLSRDDFTPGILNNRPVCRVKVGSDTKTLRASSYFETPCSWLGMPAARPAASESDLEDAVSAGAGGCSGVLIKKAASMALSEVIASDVIVKPMAGAQDAILSATVVQGSIQQAKETMEVFEASALSTSTSSSASFAPAQ